MNRSAKTKKIAMEASRVKELEQKNKVIEYTKNELAQSERELYAAVDELARLERIHNRVGMGIVVACWVAFVEGLAIATLLVVR